MADLAYRVAIEHARSAGASDLPWSCACAACRAARRSYLLYARCRAQWTQARAGNFASPPDLLPLRRTTTELPCNLHDPPGTLPATANYGELPAEARDE